MIGSGRSRLALAQATSDSSMPEKSPGLVAVTLGLKRTVIVPVGSVVRTRLFAQDVSQSCGGQDPPNSLKKTLLPQSHEK